MSTAARYLTRRMDERRDELPFARCLTAEVVLVPMPRSGASSAKPKIFGFAAARTISEGEVPDVFDPVVGTIDLHNGQTFRKP